MLEHNHIAFRHAGLERSLSTCLGAARRSEFGMLSAHRPAESDKLDPELGLVAINIG